MGSGGPGLAALPMQDASQPPACDHVELRNAQDLPMYALYWPNRSRCAAELSAYEGGFLLLV
jgi:hypothetical protein